MSDFSFTEYITVLEGDIAERDHLLDHLALPYQTRFSGIGNLSVRQEIASFACRNVSSTSNSSTFNLNSPAAAGREIK